MPKTIQIRLIGDDEALLAHVVERVVSALQEQGDYNADIRKPRPGRNNEYLAYGTIFPSGGIVREIPREDKETK